MSDALHHVAVASLPVAIGLLVLAAVARAVLWADVKDERLARVAREHLGALSIWCLILVAVHALALGAAGELGAGSFGAALAIGAAAVLLRTEGGDDDAREWAPREGAGGEAGAAEPAAGAPVAAGDARRAAPHSLWAEPEDEPASRTGLWT
jgi:hypothetical protein